jgi:ActR/RegA family two-component response regulator
VAALEVEYTFGQALGMYRRTLQRKLQKRPVKR